jgi:hypothetical protein
MADETGTPRREGLRVRKLADQREGSDSVLYADHVTGEPAKRPLLGVVFVDEVRGRRTDRVPTHIRVPNDYVQREPWIEMVNPTAVVRNAGPANNPTAKLHTFVQADELVLHMLDGSYRYRVVGQPDKYGADGEPSNAAGDPTTEVRWYFDADLIEE